MVNCPICCNKSKLLFKEISRINKKEYELYFCNFCKLEFYNPLVFENIYENEKVGAYEEFHTGRIKMPPWSKELIRIIKKLKINLNKKEIFEIGIGDGNNYKALKENFTENFNFEGIELDKKSINVCKKRGIKKIYDEYFDLNFLKKHKKKYDIILCTEVLEHQVDPKEFLDCLFKILKKDGVLILTVPNREIFLYNYRNYGDVAPHHFLKFSKDCIKNIFLKIYNKRILYLNDYSFYDKNLKISAEEISNLLVGNKFFYLFFIPLVLVLRILDKIRGEGIICIIKNQ
jgi:2-polyprenyl-3-methyl-5-hydroxy-6-metoxy-1,4-benzoquinol methylase